MKFPAKITKVHPVRPVKTEKGEFKFQPIEIEILEDCRRYDNSVFVREHSIKVDLIGKLADNFQLAEGTDVTIDLQFYINEKDGRSFQSIRSSYVALR